MIRSITTDDLPALKTVLNNCDLFPSEYLDGMTNDYFKNPETKHLWYTFQKNETVVAIAYCAPMKLTNGTFNLYAIGIHNDHQHQGIGTQMMAFIENKLKADGQRILIVETSSSDSQETARNFYLKNGYTHEATLRDFWDDGDDKVVFCKKLK